MPQADDQINILTINPGSTSTKIALYRAVANGDPTSDPQPVWSEMVSHSATDLGQFSRIPDQLAMRYASISELLAAKGVAVGELDVVVGRGGLFRGRLVGGTYAVTDAMLAEMAAGDPTGQREHASNLGILLADWFADAAARERDEPVQVYTVDPPPVDELDDIARITGWPEIERGSLTHALSLKAAGRRAGRDLGKPYAELNMVMVHLGGGISVTAHRQGRMVDVNQALDGEGPFTPERSGGLPVGDLARICFSGEYTYHEIKKKIAGKGGLVAHLGTNDAREVERRISEGDTHAGLILHALAYNVGKEIGRMAAALGSRPDAIVITGALAHSKLVMGWLTPQVEWIAPILLYPGSDEMLALAQGGYRAYLGVEPLQIYTNS